MKQSYSFLAALMCALLFTGTNLLPAQSLKKGEGQKQYLFKTVPNDPLQTRIYTLDNGLKVYLSINRTEPRIYTSIPVRAGSTSDPADATGLAHYLEHMLFKGTDKFGTQDYKAEQALITKIEDLYEVYRKTTDESERKSIYQQIDSVSNIAAKYAIPNEYDKLVANMGAKGTNAYTWHDVTCYINDIPSNQLENWLKVEAERFRKPVFRLFHTELEAVYEEKNRSLDSDFRSANEVMMSNLFPTHNYGQQTTIGTIEHLKNPSLKAIREYYENFYVPNNMAICLAGDLDFEKTIAMIDQHFGQFEPSKDIERNEFPKEKPIDGPIIKEVEGPEEAFVWIGFRMPGINHPDAPIFMLTDYILNNSEAGLIDLNLNQAQKILGGGSSPTQLMDYGTHTLRGSPREGQSLEEVKDLLLAQIELVKEGKFDEKLIDAIVNDFEVSAIRESQANWARTSKMVDAFINRMGWEQQVDFVDRMRKLRKEDVVRFANEYYKDDNYVVVYKKTGERGEKQKVVKPEITPVSLNRDANSPFAESIMKADVKKVEPKFLNYEKDIHATLLGSNIPMYYLQNKENNLFSLYYLLDMGKMQDKELAIAIAYLEYLGTESMSPEELKFKRYSLGTSMGVSAGNEQVYVSVSGLDANFGASVEILEDLIRNAQPDQEALNKMIDGILKKRTDAKLDRYTILQQAMRNYATYGAKNPFNDIMSEEELRALKAEDLVEKVKSILDYKHRVLYYGPRAAEDVAAVLDELHILSENLKEVPTDRPYQYQETAKPRVIFVDYDMVQAEIVWLSKGNTFMPELQPKIRMFNEYFGGGMGSLVFQVIRESKALAYSAWANYQTPSKKKDPHYLFAYVGTQADKIHEAIAGMQELFDDMPANEVAFNNAKEAIQRQIETERIVRTSILFNYEAAKRRGYNTDVRETIYQQVGAMTVDDLKRFQEDYVKEKTFTLMVLGSKDKINVEELKQYGEVSELSMEEIFGY